MNWFEEIPDSCPPDDAESPGGRTFYRLCMNNPAESLDFCSQRKDNPNKNFAGLSECILRSVSIWETPEKCLEQKKFPTQKKKKLGQIMLQNEDGLIKNTFKLHHYSWWRTIAFNPDLTQILE